jgi:phage shock protein A
MILGKFVTAIQAFFNGIANAIWERDPVAIYQLEVDRAAERLKESRQGVEMYKGLVNGIERQVVEGTANVARLEAQIKAYLRTGTPEARDAAAKLAIQHQSSKNDLETHKQQLETHRTAFDNHMLKLRQANEDIGKLQQKAQRMKAELKMSQAEAEMARVAEALGGQLSGNLTTDLGQVESMIKRQIDHNRGKAQVAAELSSQGVAEIKNRQAVERQMAEDLLTSFEVEMGLKSPETTPIAESGVKSLGPSTEKEKA